MTIVFELTVAAGAELSPDVIAGVADRLSCASTLLPGTISGLISVELVSEQRIVELHRDFFDDESPTDVITFPSEDDELWVSGPEDGDDLSPEAMPRAHLGDIAICVPVAVEQAHEAGHSPARELAFLALHGALHLLGYNDSTVEERTAMLALQEQILVAAERERGAL